MELISLLATPKNFAEIFPRILAAIENSGNFTRAKLARIAERVARAAAPAGVYFKALAFLSEFSENFPPDTLKLITNIIEQGIF